MKQIWPNYSYSPATNVLTLTGLNIDRDQLLLVTAADRGRIMYNFADSSVTASAFTSGVNTALTLVATTAGLTTTASLVIYYDDQLQSTAVAISNFPATQVISGTIDANVIDGSISVVGALRDGDGNTFGLTRDFPISGTVTANVFGRNDDGSVQLFAANYNGPRTYDGGGAIAIGYNDNVNNFFKHVSTDEPFPISGTVTIGSALPAGTNRIGSVTASISGTVPVSGTFWQATQPVSGTFWQTTQPVSLSTVPTHGVTLTSTTVTVSSLPALSAGTAQIGSVTASISGTVPVSGTFWQTTQPVSISSVTIGNSVAIGSCVTHGVTIANTVVTFTPAQGTTVANSNFTSTTASTSLVSADSGRKVLTVFNEGAGNLHISPGATCTTVAYQVRLSAGDYWECPAGQVTLAHTAVFATAGTARVSQTS